MIPFVSLFWSSGTRVRVTVWSLAVLCLALLATSAQAAPVPSVSEADDVPAATSQLYIPALRTGIGQPLYATRVGTGIPVPTDLTAPPGDTQRLFVTSQYGRVRILRDGTFQSSSFLDISSIVYCCGEYGLLSLAFHPNYAQNGYFYVSYVDHSNHLIIERYTVSDDPDVADRDSALKILEVYHPAEPNHYGGQLQFGRDGYLYISTGDGADPGDPYNNSQNPATLMGKILRIDVDSGTPYAIPPTNPFAGTGDPRDEIWSLGLRNPWRFSFDPLTGNMWIGDVGQRRWEEINMEPAASPGGRNYGWDCYEGTHDYEGNSALPYCQGKTFTWPVHEYPHSPTACSVTGGYVFRGRSASPYYGIYVYADFCTSNKLFTIHNQNGTFSAVERSLILPTGQDLSYTASFGRDANGDIYALDRIDGDVYRIQF